MSARLGDGVRQKELATALSIEGPSLVRLLDNLERRGFIERREDETDRRARGIYLRAPAASSPCAPPRIGSEHPDAGCWPACRRPISKPASACCETLEREMEEPARKRAEEPSKRRKR